MKSFRKPSIIQRLLAIACILVAVLTWLLTNMFVWFATPLFIIAVLALLLKKQWKKAISLFFIAFILITSWQLGLNRFFYIIASGFLILGGIGLFIPLRLPSKLKPQIAKKS